MPRRDKLPHIHLPDRWTERRDYVYAKPVSGTPPNLPPRAPGKHGAKLLADLAAVKGQTPAVQAARQASGLPADGGLLLEFESAPGFDLALQALDRKREGLELVSVRERGNVTLATVYVPDGGLNKLAKLIDDYRKERILRGNVANEKLAAPTEAIRMAAVESLWTDEGGLPAPTVSFWWEVWLRKTPTALDTFRALADAQQISVSDTSLEFIDRIVVLAYASVDQLAASVELLDCLAELRMAKELASFFMDLAPRDQWDWVHATGNGVVHPGPDAPALCLLDTGVNRGHPLLEPLIAPDDLHAVDAPWGRVDHDGHGTEMAGLGAWGDLTVALAGYPPPPRHVLESVVLLPPKTGTATPPKLYGAYTASAVALPEVSAPLRKRVFCMTITAKDFRDRGKPSSWSAEVDILSHGRRDQNPRLFFLSAGNVVPQSRWAGGLDECDTEQVHDPGQSWNALTVGAYTEKVWFDATVYPGQRPIMAAGSLSPASSTSLTWESPWPTKPDIVMEGGNASVDGAGTVDVPDDLRLLSTYWKPTLRLLTTTGDTSGAAALAARMGAQVLAEYPGLWAETVRALIVHSAQWTQGMHASLPPGLSQQKRKNVLLRRYGWGAPNLGRVLYSATNALTLVAERVIQPFQNVADAGKAPDVKTKDWHLFSLPWPVGELQALGGTNVELRVTLSYFVEPNPARRGWRARHRYQSYGLRFALQNATESLDEFRARVSKHDQDEDEGLLPGFSEPGWVLGPQLRDRGSILSDTWTGSAADLAARDHLAIYPVGGWWKDRPAVGRYEEGVRYALVVSIHVPDVDVDIYTPVAVTVGVAVPIEV